MPDSTFRRGMSKRNYQDQPLGSNPNARLFNADGEIPEGQTIPEDEWPDRIKEMADPDDDTRLSSTVRYYLKKGEMQVLNQGQTLLCWANAPVNCVQVLRAKANQSRVALSPASVASPVTGGVDQVGYALDALHQIASVGIAPVKDWPANDLTNYYTSNPGLLKEAEKYQVTDWRDLNVQNFAEIATYLLCGFPVAVGYSRFGHEVTALDLVQMDNGEFGLRIWNSWGTGRWNEGWPEHDTDGMCVLPRSYGPDNSAIALINPVRSE